ncbi:MAG: NAD(+) diphosphatase [Deltaproteobacteria bacterium]|nr:NAD(+) diphosphatase [Deltaproteobacteria bacterium]
MDHYTRSARNTFAGLHLDRKPFVHQGHDDPFVHLAAPSATFVVVRHDEILFDPGSGVPLLLGHRDVARCADLRESALLLGADDHAQYFALDYSRLSTTAGNCVDGLGVFEKLRQHTAILPPEQAALLGFARSAVGWTNAARFCSACGHPTQGNPLTLARVCSNPDCGKHHFPRVDPAMIVLVHRDDSCLLGRQTSWRPRMYSAIAGYVEPGESVEDAVCRETWEETGIRLGDIRYHSSQPWPFSGSIMLGFHATAKTTDIRLADQELEDARWFSRAEIPDLLDQGVLVLPPTDTIARRLFDAWFTPRHPS